ncbi:MAG: arylamine N-acetyltransferase [Polyangia bacterium]|jgi:arylamine N-acetyltransferase|nr:arylamine N-acetyltransferase [Polyangia bacterium]
MLPGRSRYSSGSPEQAANRRAADAFLEHYRILPRGQGQGCGQGRGQGGGQGQGLGHGCGQGQRLGQGQDLLWEVGEAFARLPYENLTKILKKVAEPPGPARRRLPWEVVLDHAERGTGGTCFSLTETFLAVLERLGYSCRPVLCDMRAGRDSHSAVWIELPEGPHLMDPGYLLHQPLPLLPGATSERATSVGVVRVTGSKDGETFELTSGGKHRYRLKAAAVSRERFLALWDASFDWSHMGNLHLSRATDGGYAYLHGHRLRLQREVGRENVNLVGRLPVELSARFGLAPAVVAEAEAALSLLRESRPGNGDRDRNGDE